MRFAYGAMMFLVLLCIGWAVDRTSALEKTVLPASNQSAAVGPGSSSSISGEVQAPLRGLDYLSSPKVPSVGLSSCERVKDTSHSTDSAATHHEPEHVRRCGLICRLKLWVSAMKERRGRRRESRMQRLRSTVSQH